MLATQMTEFTAASSLIFMYPEIHCSEVTRNLFLIKSNYQRIKNEKEVRFWGFEFN